MEPLLKTYGIFVGFILGIFSVYIKHFIDKKIEARKTKGKLKKIYSLIKDSPPPEWIKTYTEPKVEMIYAAFHRNAGNLSQFRSRIQTINAYINEISSEVYSHLGTTDIIKFHEIKFWSESILREINEDKEKFQRLDFSTNKELRSFGNLENLTESELEKVKELAKTANANQSKFESYIIGTSTLFLMIKFGHQNMSKAYQIKRVSTLKYDYEYNEDE